MRKTLLKLVVLLAAWNALFAQDVPPKSDAPRPRLLLRGFQRVRLMPGEATCVSFAVPDERLAFWNTEAKRFAVAPGEWRVLLGASSDDIRLQTKVIR